MAVDGNEILEVVGRYELLRQQVRELRRAGNLELAVPKAIQALEYLEQHQEGLGFLLTAGIDLATLSGAAGDWPRAEVLLERCRYVRTRVCGARDKDTATALMMLGVAKYYLQNYSDAEPLLRESLEIREEALGRAHPDVALALMNLAALYDKTERTAEAELLRGRAERIGLPSFVDES